MKRLRIGDIVKVISGFPRGKKRELEIDRMDKNQKMEIRGIIIGFPRAYKQTVAVALLEPATPWKQGKKWQNEPELNGQVLLHESNLMLWDEDANRADRIGYKIVEGQKYRYFKKSGNLLQNIKIPDYTEEDFQFEKSKDFIQEEIQTEMKKEEKIKETYE